MNDNTVAFIGAGNMARCVIAAMVRAGYPAGNIIAANRSQPKLTALANDFGIQTTLDNIAAVTQADIIVLAVKPQMMQEVCEALIAAAPESAEKLFVTLAAGIPVMRYQQWLGQVRLVRAMPNTPSLVGLGVTGLFPSGCSNYEKAFVDHMFSGTGLNVWLDNEAQINHVIAVTGSSPAYFIFFMQAMQQVAEQLGFDASQVEAEKPEVRERPQGNGRGGRNQQARGEGGKDSNGGRKDKGKDQGKEKGRDEEGDVGADHEDRAQHDGREGPGPAMPPLPFGVAFPSGGTHDRLSRPDARGLRPFTGTAFSGRRGNCARGHPTSSRRRPPARAPAAALRRRRARSGGDRGG